MIITTLLRRTLTFAVDARFSSRAIFITAATKNAPTADASLIQLTLSMRDAGYHALVVDALLAVRTVGGRSAHG